MLKKTASKKLYFLLIAALIFVCFTLGGCKRFTVDPNNPIGTDGTVDHFTVTFSDGGNTTAKNVETGKAVTPLTPEKKTGYTFKGWSLTDGGELIDFSAITDDVTLYAVWEVLYYTVEFLDKNDDAIMVNGAFSQSVRYGEAAVAPDAPVVEGCIFTGWDKAYDNVTKPLIVKAIYEGNVVSVTFMSFGEQLRKISGDYGGEISDSDLAAPTKPGFKFLGWVDKDGNSVYTTPVGNIQTGPFMLPSSDVTIYAKWELAIPGDLLINASTETESLTYGDACILTAAVTEYDDVNYTYKWFRHDANSGSYTHDGSAALAGETAKTLDISSENAGDWTYFAEVTASAEGFTSVSTINSIRKNIGKAAAVINTNAVVKNYTYTGALQAVNAGATLNHAETELVYTDNTFTTVAEGNGKVVTISAAATTNYRAAEATVTLTVNKAAAVINTNAVVKNYTYTGALQAVNAGATLNHDETTLVYANNTFKTVAEGDGLVVTISAAATDNYKATSANVTLTVNKATVTITAADKTVTYGEDAPSYNALPYSLLGSDAIALTLYSSYEQGDDAGEYDITVTGESDDYAFAFIKGTLTVERADATIDVAGVVTEYTYNGAAQTVNAGATLNHSETELVYTNNSFTTVSEGDGLVVTISAAQTTNYNAVEETVTITVNKAAATISTAGVNLGYTYNGAAQTVNAGAILNHDEATLVYTNNTFTTVSEGDGLVVGISVAESDNYLAYSTTVTIAVAKATATIDTTGVNTFYTYTGALQTVSAGATLNHTETELVYADNSFTTVAQGDGKVVKITAAETGNYLAAYATVTLGVAKAKVTKPTLNSDNLIYNGSTVTAAIAESTLYCLAGNTARNAGKYDATAALSDPDNYTWADETSADVTIRWNVAKRAASVTANNYTITYGAAIPTDFSASCALLSGDSATFTFTTNYVAGASVGSYYVRPADGSNANYEYTYVDGTLTVETKTLTLHVDASKNYDGAVWSSSVTAVDGTLSGHTFSGVLATNQAALGTYDTADDFTWTTAWKVMNEDANVTSNYTLNTTLKVVIGEGNIAKSASGYTGNYDGAAHTGSVVVTTPAAGYTLTYSSDNATFGSDVPTFKNAGTHTVYYRISADGYTTVNDSFTVVINPMAVTVTANDKAITYGDAVPTDFTATAALISGDSVTFSFATDYDQGDGVGAYTITPSGSDTNYDFTFNAGKLTVSQKPLTVNASASKEYDGSTLSANATADGLLSGHVFSGTVTTNSANLGSYDAGKVVWSTAWKVLDDTVDFTANYSVELTAALSITSGSIVYTATPYSGKYDGAYHTIAVAVTFPENVATVTYSTDNVTFGSTNPSYKDAGSYTVYYRISAAGYETVTGSATVTISAKEVTVTANDKAITYGDAVPTDFTATAALISGDTVTFNFATDYDQGDGVGTYVITPSGSDTNYDFTFVDGTLTVGARPVTVTANDATATYGDDVPADFSASYTLYGSDTVAFNFTTDYDKGDDAGNYYVRPSGTLANYDFTFVDGTLAVGKKAITAKADNKTITYGDTVPTDFTAAVTGLVGSDTLSLQFTTTYSQGANVGSYDINITAATYDNYTVTRTKGILTVGKVDYTGITHAALTGTYSPTGKLNDYALAEHFSWVAPTTVPTVAVTSYAAKYNADAVNYNDFNLNITLTLARATATITAAALQEFDWDGNVKNVEATLNHSETTLSYGPQRGYTDGGTYTITVSAAQSANYLAATPVTVTLKIKSVKYNNANYTIDDALSLATSGTITVFGNTVLNSNRTVASGVTLLLPYSATDTTGYLGAGEDGSDNYNAHPASNGTATLYRTLIIPSSITLNVNGNLTVGALTGQKNAGSQQNKVSGEYSRIVLDGNIVTNNATIRVMGYITGNGTITANSTTVIENLYLSGWMGGTISTARYAGEGYSIAATSLLGGGTLTISNPNMFPFSQYELRSIQVTLILNYGSKLQGYTKIATSALSAAGLINIPAQINEAVLTFVSSSTATSSGLVRLIDSNSKVIKSFSNDRVKFDIYGNVADGYSSLSINVLGCTANMSTEKVLFPIDGRTDITLKSGATFTQSYKYKFMPGATLTVDAGATYNMNGNLFMYTSEFTDITTYSYPGAARGDAKLTVNGTMNLNGSFGGDIYSTASGKVVVASGATLSLKSINGTGSYEIDKGILINAKVIFHFTENGSVTKSATFKNSDGTTVAAAKGRTYTYNGTSWS